MSELLETASGTFHIERQFTEGKNGTTYLLKETSDSGKPLVCKVVNLYFGKLETRNLAKIYGKPHMVKYIKELTGPLHGQWYIFMEYAGPSLYNVRPDSATRVDIMVQLVDAIKTLLSLNLMAEDIARQNLCYDDAGYLTLIDFGECVPFDDSEMAAMTSQYFSHNLYIVWRSLGGSGPDIREFGNIKREDQLGFTLTMALARLDAMRAALRPSEVAAPAVPKRVKTGTIQFWP